MPDKVIQVAPLRRLPRSKGVFDYSLPASLRAAVGDLVVVPFRNRLTLGVVIAIGSSRSQLTDLKPVNQLLASAWLNKKQILMLKWFSQYTGISLATAVKLIVPALPRRGVPLSVLPPPPSTFTFNRKGQRLPPINILPGSVGQNIEIVKQLVDKVTARGQQILILVPTISYLNYWLNKLQPERKAVSYSGRLSTVQSRQVWLEVREGRAQIVVGTWPALWLNYHNLGGVVVIQADNENFFQAEQNPRHDTLQVARFLTNLWGVPLAFITAAPRLESWLNRKLGKENWQLVGRNKVRLSLINMSTALKVDKAGLISEELKDQLQSVLAQKKRVLLYLNRRGAATASICRDCGWVPVCRICQRRLVQTNDQQILICFHCNDQQPLAVPCPVCGGSSVDYRGGGLARLTKEVMSLWPQARLAVIEDKFTPEQIKSAQKAEIILGSRTILSVIEELTFGLIALVNIDVELARPEFRAAESVWQLSRYLTQRTEMLAVQTRQPEHHLWRALASAQIDYFYRREFELRQKYHYPPLVRLTRFICQATDNTLALRRAQELKIKLLKQISPPLELIGPYQDYYQRRFKRWLWYLLLKHPPTYNPIKLWPYLPEEVLVDRDPWFILS